MSDVADLVQGLSPKAREGLRRQLGASEPEPVAIIGVAMRLPGGVSSPSQFWDFLVQGSDGITTVPTSRWETDAISKNTQAGRTSRWGGFIDGVDLFDTGHFGISPAEASSMDPQQRLLLETTAEALVHAGLPAAELRGSDTGVFVGMSSNDHMTLGASRGWPVDAYTATGNPHSVAVGRISYVFDFKGPSLAIDTACSSSLVAADVAFHSLRERRCGLAVIGGVHLMLDPNGMLALGKWAMLSPDGRCKTFDARADGFVRGEGCAVLIAKRLRDAQRDGDRIWAVMKGSAVNQDGRSSGLTAPNVDSQAAVMRSALTMAGVHASSVAMVETHGTGTSLGDPIEFSALASVYGAGSEPCFLGALKTNIGHLEAAAGVAGLAKAVLCVQQRQVPPNQHFRSWNPSIDAAGLRLDVPLSSQSLWSVDDVVTVGVSAFGFGGTNAHVVLQSPPTTSWPSVFVFPGQGGQFPQMGKRLLAESSVFAARVREIEPDFQRVAGFSLEAALDGSFDIENVAHEQPALFGFQLAAAAMMEALQGPPLGVIGHSMGEVAALVVAGVLSLEQGLEVITVRSRLLQQLPDTGAMAVVPLGRDETARLIVDHGSLEVAAENSSNETVVSGTRADIDDIVQNGLAEHGPVVRPIRVSVGSHSHLVDPILGEIRSALTTLGPVAEGRCPVYSSTPGKATFDADYWVRNVRGVVGFASAARQATQSGVRRFSEISPTPVLREALRTTGERGVRVQAAQIRPLTWRHASYRTPDQAGPQLHKGRLLTEHVVLPDGTQWSQGFPADFHPWLDGHKLFDVAVLPAAAVIQLFLECAASAPNKTKTAVKDISMRRLLTLADLGRVSMEVDAAGDMRLFTGGEHHKVGATGRSDEAQQVTPLAGPSGSLRRTVPGSDIYSLLRTRGQSYGAAFRRLQTVELWEDGWVRGQFDDTDDAVSETFADLTGIDAALQMMVAALPDADGDSSFLPVEVGECTLHEEMPRILRAVGHGRSEGADWLVDLDLWGYDWQQPAVMIRGLRVTRLKRADAPIAWSQTLFDVEWQDVDVELQTGSEIAMTVQQVGPHASPLWQTLTEAGPEDAASSVGAHRILVVADDAAASLATRTRLARMLMDEVAATLQSVDRPSHITIVATGPTDGPCALTASALVRTISLEMEDVTPRALLVDGAATRASIDIVRAEWPSDVLLMDDAGLRQPRLTRLSGLPEADLVIRTDAAYLITGGFGGLGLRLAAWLLERGAGRVVLNGRNVPVSGTNSEYDQLLAGGRVVAAPGNLSEPATMDGCLAAAQAGGLVLRGVAHAAAVVEDQPFSTLSKEVADRVWKPKVEGLLELDEATRQLPLDFFVAFSSAAAVLGSPGQASYASANAAMEALVNARRDQGLVGSTIQWGRWGEVGRAASESNELMHPIDPSDGLHAFSRLVGSNRRHTLVARLNQRSLFVNFPLAAKADFFSELMSEAGEGRTLDFGHLRQLPPNEAASLVHELTRQLVADVLGYSVQDLSTTTPLTNLGIDSLMALRLIRVVNQQFGIELGVSTVLEGPNVKQLAYAVLSLIRGEDPEDESRQDTARSAAARASVKAARMANLRERKS